MIAWLRSAALAPAGGRKLLGLVWALLAAVVVTLGACGLLLIASDAQAPHIVSVALGGLGGVATLYAALVGGNAAEHRHAGGGKASPALSAPGAEQAS